MNLQSYKGDKTYTCNFNKGRSDKCHKKQIKILCKDNNELQKKGIPTLIYRITKYIFTKRKTKFLLKNYQT